MHELESESPPALARAPVRGPSGTRATDEICEKLAEDRFLIDGRELALPMRIADFTLFAQAFSVPIVPARELLAGTGLAPLELWPGTGALTLMAVDYRDNPLGDYHEAVIALAVDARGGASWPLLGGLDILRQRAGHFVYAMPVDQEFTTHAGRFLWGYPKFLAELEFELSERSLRARFAHAGELVFALSGPIAERGSLHASLETVTCRDGVLRSIRAEFAGRGFAFRLGGEPPELGTRHAIARTLRGLGLPKRPLCTLSLRHAHADFPPAVAR